MAVLVNRGNKIATDPEFYRLREERRELRAEFRRTHRHIGWVCPFCDHHQVLVYATQERLPGEPLPTLPRWMTDGAINVRCENIVRDRSGAVVADCGLLCRVALIEATGNQHALAWLYWSDAKHEHEALQDRREAIADGYRADPKTWERGAGLLVPRFSVEPPPFLRLDALQGNFSVVPLEARESSTMSIITLWLPHGHLKVPVVTDYKEDGQHYVELNVPLPFQRNLRDDLLQLISPENRDEHDNANRNVYLRSPYGTGPYCWTGKLRTTTTVETLPEEITDKLQQQPDIPMPEFPGAVPDVVSNEAPPDAIGGDSWFDLDDEDLTADVPWCAVEEYISSQG